MEKKIKIKIINFFSFSFIITVAPNITDTTLSSYRSKRNANDKTPLVNPPYCDRFVKPIKENSTFFSPLDPKLMRNTYPPNADCVYYLEGMYI